MCIFHVNKNKFFKFTINLLFQLHKMYLLPQKILQRPIVTCCLLICPSAFLRRVGAPYDRCLLSCCAKISVLLPIFRLMILFSRHILRWKYIARNVTISIIFRPACKCLMQNTRSSRSNFRLLFWVFAPEHLIRRSLKKSSYIGFLISRNFFFKNW